MVWFTIWMRVLLGVCAGTIGTFVASYKGVFDAEDRRRKQGGEGRRSVATGNFSLLYLVIASSLATGFVGGVVAASTMSIMATLCCNAATSALFYLIWGWVSLRIEE